MFTNKPNKCYQTEDGPIWHSRSVAVTGVVFMATTKDDMYVLLTKRSDTMEDMPGRWCLPCGYLDWGEDLEHATAREICEETSLDVYELRDLFKFPNFHIDSNPRSNRQNIAIASAYYKKVKALPKITTTLETSMVEWVPFNYSSLRGKDLVFDHHNLIVRAWNTVEDSLLANK
jgi:ADP-ribose pyrophosphatase YjhB (NUDIX family)